MLTFKQAKDELTVSTLANYGSADIGRSINKALRALVKLHPLRCFRKVFRFTSAGPGFVLPQGSAGLVRACVNGCPVTMRGQDFRFLLSGPGDMDRPPFRQAENVIALGPKPVMFEPKSPFSVFFTYDGTSVLTDVPHVTVRGYAPDGTLVSCECVPSLKTASATYTPSSAVFSEITDIVLGSGGTKYLTLYAHDASTDEEFSLGVYNPTELVPSFMHYELQGVPPGKPVELLAEVRMDHIDMVADTDVLPVDTTEPVEYMIRADWEMKSGEVQRAETYRQKAEEWLEREEMTANTVQTKITINSDFWGSPGEVSAEAFNI